MRTIKAKGIQIYTFVKNQNDYISLTDIARYRNPDEPKDLVKNWIRTRSTIEFLGAWEKIYNPLFKGVEFDAFRMDSGLNSFVLSPQKWIDKTGAIGLVSRSGNGGGTFAHSDIAYEFATWISPEFKLYIIKEFKRLKYEENERISTGWDVKRTLTKMNYRIHTDAIKKNLIPEELSPNQKNMIYANEADVLNLSIFGMTAATWIRQNPKKEGNIRDYASVEQLVVLANLESINAEFIKSGLSQPVRLGKLNAIAIYQMNAILGTASLKKLSQQASS